MEIKQEQENPFASNSDSALDAGTDIYLPRRPPSHLTCVLCGATNKPPPNTTVTRSTNQPSSFTYHKLATVGGRYRNSIQDLNVESSKSLCCLLFKSITQASLSQQKDIEEFSKLMINGPYCDKCTQVIWDINTTLHQIKVLQRRLDSLRNNVISSLERKLNKLRSQGSIKSEFGEESVNSLSSSEENRHERQRQILQRFFTDWKYNPSAATSYCLQQPWLKFESRSEIQPELPESSTTTLDEVNSKVDKYTSDSLWEFLDVGVLSDDAEDEGGDFNTNNSDDEYVPQENLNIISDNHNQDHQPRKRKRIRKPRPRTKKPSPGEAAGGCGARSNGNLGKPIPTPCLICGEICVSRESHRKHIKEFHAEHRINCPTLTCTKTFKLQSTLDAHIRTEHGGGIFTFNCRLCGKGYNVQEELDTHEKLHTGSSTPFLCVLCSSNDNLMVFTNSADLHSHVKEHENPICCSQCTKRFSTEEDLVKHEKHHFKKCLHICDLCGEKFRTKYHFNEHYAAKHGGPNLELQFSCDICGKAYSMKKTLKRHLQIHSDVRAYECPICKKCFYRGYELKKHEETHSGFKSYTCTICGKGFEARQNLAQHVRIHDKTVKRKVRIRHRKPKVPVPLLVTSSVTTTATDEPELPNLPVN